MVFYVNVFYLIYMYTGLAYSRPVLFGFIEPLNKTCLFFFILTLNFVHAPIIETEQFSQVWCWNVFIFLYETTR